MRHISCFLMPFLAGYSMTISIAAHAADAEMLSDAQWGEKRCMRLPQESQEACMAAHKRLGITPNRLLKAPAVNADQEELRRAMDIHLSATLKDPLSAIQYQVSDAFECGDVVLTAREYENSWCACYIVNAKNSMGGFSGATVGIGMLIAKEPPYLMEELPENLIVNAQACPNMRPRDSALIHAQVK